MIRGELNRPFEPTPESTAGPTSRVGRVDRGFRAMMVVVGLAFLLILVGSRPTEAAKSKDLPEGLITEIKCQGNQTITETQIRGHIKSRVGRALDRTILDDDLRALNGTKWFSDVRIDCDTSPKGDGVVLIIVVVEMPMLREVQFIGLHKVKLKDVEETTNLKKGARADWMVTRAAISKIQTLYEEKGYEKAEIRLIEGGNPGDNKVVIEIFEGPKFKIESITFVGNTFVEDDVLATKIESRRGFFGILGAKRYKDSLENDRRALIKYYQDHGYFDVEVQATVKPGTSLGQEQITYTISEKIQYKVRKILFEGNEKIPAEVLSQGLLMKPGEPYNEGLRDLDYKTIISRYWAKGCIKTAIEKDQPVTNEPGFVDVVYRVTEGSTYYLGQLIFKGNVHTKEKVFRREYLMAGMLPGEILDLNRLDKAKQRILGTGYVAKQTQPGVSKGLDVQIKNERPGDKPFGEDVFVDVNSVIPGRLQSPEEAPNSPGPSAPTPSSITLGGPSLVRKKPTVVPASLAAEAKAAREASALEETRMQSGEPEIQLPGDPPSLPPLDVGSSTPVAPAPAPSVIDPGTAGGGPSGLNPFGRPSGIFDPPANTVPAIPVTPPPTSSENPGPNPKIPPTGGPVDRGDRNPGLFPNTPNLNMTDVGPDRQEPFANRSFADIVTSLDEAPTGRIMFGVGASSFGGLNGNVILHESNFDLFAVPRSWSELTSGRAFRGAGQEFRIELSPGTLINRYVVSFRDPYLFDLPIGLGVSGYQWSRYYPDWSERRSGGRASLGYQFGPQVYADVAARIEDVDIHGFKYPAPADLLSAAGHSTLATIRPSVRFDNRNNPTSPSEGSYLEAAFEQGFGTYTFPKVTLEGRQHFTTGSRPDNSGKRTLALRGFFGATGRDTPIYERFFAGDFRSMRGFYYRGVGPHNLGVNTGGVLTAIGSIEYQFPWNASDTIQQVFFCDFGTVEADYKFTTFRAAVGTGARIVIPQITGQLPLAFDIAFPVAKAEGDHVRYFTFFIGAFW